MGRSRIMGARTLHLAGRGLALSGLLLGGPLAVAPASAQDSPTAAERSRAEAAMRAELARVESESATLRRSLDRFERGRTGPLSELAIDSLEQLVRRLAALRAQQVQLAQTLRWQSEGAQAAAQTRRVAPTGWLGIVASTNGYATSGRDGMVLQAGEYPVIVSVEPGSPAARAGVLAGDRLLALKGLDVQSQRVPLGALLRPGTTLPVRVERDGLVRDFQVEITARPRAFPPTVTMRVQRAPDGRFALGEPAPRPAMSPRSSTPSTAPRAVAASGAASGVVVVPVAPSAPGSPRAEYVSVAPPAPAPPLPGMFGGGALVAVAGAEVARMNDDLREAFGVERGVLVLNVGRRSPAEQAGLRAGDVIVGAGDAEISSPASLVRALRAWEGNRLRLEVVRKRQRRVVELRR